MLWTFTLGKVQKKLEKIKEIGQQVRNLRNLGGFWQFLLVFFTLVLTKPSHSTLRKFLAKGIEQGE